jgi:hypothetical protein
MARLDMEETRYQLLSAAERDAIVAEHLREHLMPLGLAHAAPRIWIDASLAPAKRMFELVVLKGAALRARWGFSLDFVPHISGEGLRWHRSAKMARLDIIVEPGKDPLLEPTFIRGAKRLRDDLRQLLPAAAAKAAQTWQRGATEHGLLDLVQEIRERETNCLPFDTYTQLPLAYALLFARLGDLASAEQELDRYASRLKLPESAAAKLRKLAHDYSRNAPPQP